MVDTETLGGGARLPFVQPELDRRRFLIAGAGLVGMLGAGCGSSGSKASVTTSGGSSPGPFAVRSNVFDFIAGINQRVSFALETNSGSPIHPTDPVTVQIGRLDRPLDASLATTLHGDGLANPYLLTYHQFDAPGLYKLRVSYQGGQSDLPIQVIAASDTPIPLAGKPMIVSPTPTNAAPLGVSPLCTAQPPCPLHQVSLDAALAAHRPVALQFATPALCTSRQCGPTLDNLVAVHQAYADRVTFIHCEIYTDLSGNSSVGAVSAYHLEHEPMLLLAGPDGVVKERIDNAYDRGEASDALNRLVG